MSIYINNFNNIQDNVHMNTDCLSNAFGQFTVYVRITIISELFRPVEKTV